MNDTLGTVIIWGFVRRDVNVVLVAIMVTICAGMVGDRQLKNRGTNR